MQLLKANTEVIVRIGPFVDVGDGFTPQTDITLGGNEAELLKAASVEVDISGRTWTATTNCRGWYDLTLTTDDTGTEGTLTVVVQDDSDCLPVYGRFMVMAEAAWDSMFAVKDTGFMDVNVKAISEDETAADNLEATYDTTGYSDDSAPATQAQVGNLTSGSAAINTTAKDANDGFVITTGADEANDEDSTHALDGATHDLEDVGNTTDCYYIFSVGGNGVPVSVTWQGYGNAQGDTWNFYAYNWGGAAWEQVGSIDGAAGTTIVTETFDLTNAHVGTGASLGLVHFRIYSTDGTKIATDRVLCAYAVVAQSVGYANGAIWVDTNNGVAGTEAYVNGTADNPCRTWAEVKTLSAALKIYRVELVAGSSITLDASVDNWSFVGYGSTIALGGVSAAGALFDGPKITGNDDGSNAVPVRFKFCNMNGGNTLGLARMRSCLLTGDITVAEAGTYVLKDCACGVSPPASFNFAAAGNNHVSIANWAGGLEIENMAAGDTACLTGNGPITLNANCGGGTIGMGGNMAVTDNAGGNVTLSDDARIDVDQILNALVDDATQIDASALNTHAAGTAQTGDSFAIINGASGSVATKTLLDAVAGYIDTEIAALVVAVIDNADGADVATDVAALKVVADAIQVITDALTAAAATKLALSAGTMVPGTVNTANVAPSNSTIVIGGDTINTTIFQCDDITELTADHFNGRIVIFNGSGDALYRQASDVLDYEWDAGNGEAKFTVRRLTELPSNDDSIIMV